MNAAEENDSLLTELANEPIADDALANLEQRIHRAVQVITDLRSQNDSFQGRLKKTQEELASVHLEREEAQQLLDEFQKENGALEARVQRLTQELETLRNERKQVKSRIEKLMGQLDLLSAS